MAPLKYRSTNTLAPPVTFGEALLAGQAPDRGLYMPEEIPKMSLEVLEPLSGCSYQEAAFQVLRTFLHPEVPDEVLSELTKDAYDFPVPLEKVHGRRYLMRLDQGPTASFKDFAARMMARLMSFFLQKDSRKLTVLTATSGDTGSAIAHAFHGVPNINVVILYPAEEVTDSQRRQMTTLGGNVRTAAVNGKFDDCQWFVKRAFSDEALSNLGLTSANSINIGRLLPQSVYYFYAWAQLRSSLDEPIVFSIPSGNFGNMMGCMIARRMGLPMRRTVVAANENDEFPQFLATGSYRKIVPSLNCISSAMNVGHPSNLARLVDLYGGRMDEQGLLSILPDMEVLKNDIFAVSVDDAATKGAVREVWDSFRVLIEPHGAVGWAGMEEYQKHASDEQELQVVLETAHPAKFKEHIDDILGFSPEPPPSLAGLEDLEESYDVLDSDYRLFRAYLQR